MGHLPRRERKTICLQVFTHLPLYSKLQEFLCSVLIAIRQESCIKVHITFSYFTSCHNEEYYFHNKLHGMPVQGARIIIFLSKVQVICIIATHRSIYHSTAHSVYSLCPRTKGRKKTCIVIYRAFISILSKNKSQPLTNNVSRYPVCS